MRIRINESKCQGRGQCIILASLYFDSDELGQGFVIGDEDVAADDVGMVLDALHGCPAHAIEIVA